MFFLKSSFWSQHQNAHHEDFENELNTEHSSDDSFEPVSPEFHGKEAIRYLTNYVTMYTERQQLKKGNCNRANDRSDVVIDDVFLKAPFFQVVRCRHPTFSSFISGNRMIE